MKRRSMGTLWAGLGLIGLGVALILANWLGWERLWPSFPIVGGLAAFLGYFASGRSDEGLAFLGTAALLVGAFFLSFTLGYLEWGEMSRLWPVFPLIGGAAFAVLFLAAGRRRDWGVLGLALAALIVGGVGLAYTHDYVEGSVVRFWPVLVILAGVMSLVGALSQAARRR